MADQHQKKSESLEDFEEISPSMVVAEYKYTADDLLAVRKELEKIEMVKKADSSFGLKLGGNNAAPNTPVEKPINSKSNWDHLFGMNNNAAELMEENRKLKEEIEGLKEKLNENSTTNPLEAMKELVSGVSSAMNKMSIQIRELESPNLADGQGKLANSNEGNKNVGILDYTALKKSIWNEQECARNLAISEDGLVVSHKGYFGFGSIRGNIPIKIDLECPKEYIASYYEVHIRSLWEQENNNQNAAAIFVGFCSDQFALGEEAVGKVKNSVGICGKHGVHIDGFLTRYSKEDARSRKYSDGKYFWREGDVIGCGLICFPAQGTLKCFFTCNGNVLEWRRSSMVLPEKFAQMQLFPAVSLNRNGTSISANFGQDGWRYDASQHLKRFNREIWF